MVPSFSSLAWTDKKTVWTKHRLQCVNHMFWEHANQVAHQLGSHTTSLCIDLMYATKTVENCCKPLKTIENCQKLSTLYTLNVTLDLCPIYSRVL